MFDFRLLISAIVFVSLDFIYLSIFKNYFLNQMKKIQGMHVSVNYFSMVLCYIFLIFGINYFIIKPNKSANDAFLLGLVIYGVYESTNYALFKKWNILMVFIDTLWGGILFGSTTYITYKLRNLFKM